MSDGIVFEEAAKEFFGNLLERVGYTVTAKRRQKAGTQNGFDLFLKIIDNTGEKELHFECKDYSSDLQWKDFQTKILQLHAMKMYKPDCFIGLSPKSDVTNINHHEVRDLENMVGFPIEIWSPETFIKEIFALDKDIFKTIYNEECTLQIDEEKVLTRTKVCIDTILRRKLLMKIAKRIVIEDSKKDPKEDALLKTNLDKKLMAIMGEDDPLRKEYHKLRCDYKICLEDLQDKDNDLRTRILEWQRDIRLMAFRLTKKFKEGDGYRPIDFFNDFLEEAKKMLLMYLEQEKCSTEVERLLHGVVFELAAECPLDWRK